MDITQLPTPALIVDFDKMKNNLREMQQRIDALELKLRPHTKAHKNPAIAQMQIDAGAQGICTAKLGEAEVMAAGGINDILITTPIAGKNKIQRLVKLYQQYPDYRFIQVIDHQQHVIDIAQAATEAGICIELMIEVESGQQRCGVEIGNDLVSLIEAINYSDGVSYVGLQAYSGHLQHIKGYQERNTQARTVVEDLFNYINTVLKPKGLAPDIISGGGTGTYAAYQGLGFSEIQAGSYLFMDTTYQAIGDENNQDQNNQFDVALKVLSTVISHPSPQRAVIDAGMKCLSIDLGMPKVEGDSTLSYKTGGDEHGIINLIDGHEPLQIGQQLILLPSHCDTTLNNFDTLYAIRGTEVIEQFPILGRGRSD
ncbi:DSD1 family PLP-dependent enzyme [Photobacterium kishitanii]|uniref:DSD1 family PLP-dependent enzyme n=1 Tax=Photobacterium kishitanii TaxID=318456 RepID=UPI0005D3F7BA|nr:DSD1 family PLP-dependent enzyme [Photobacterium kishitanii]KJG10613.1 threonine aldolase [Photobacterium kishitanii]PSV07937.1 DSD1 family PLP-dependent enzyme [Photobacterium kishitanii]PSV72915.1 DSD1 family PLP-dependent enzyme [Photobacterium kishitanii]